MESGAYAGLARSMPHTCNLCKQARLLKCSRCHAAWYCEAAHQKLDFPSHRQICRAIQSLRQQPLPSDLRELRQLVGDVQGSNISKAAVQFALQKRLELKIAQRLLGRQLQRNESELIMFQDKCVVCFEGGIHPIEAQGPVTLYPCESCHLVSWCQEHRDHAPSKEHHLGACASYTLVRECERHSALAGEPFVQKEFPPEADYQALPPDWSSYFVRRGGEEAAAAMDECHKAMASAYLSIPLTMLYALERMLGSHKLKEAQSLCVHLLGTAIGAEYICMHADRVMIGGKYPEKYLEIMHCLPALKQLDIVMIGPENDDLMAPLELPCKDVHGSDSRVLRIATFRAFYHDFASKLFKPPHLVLALNAGLHELPFPNAANSWLPTLRLLADRAIPSVFTAFTPEEWRLDAAVARKADVKLTVHGELNPWRGLHPLQEMESTNEFFYLNHILWAFEGKE